MQESKSIIDNWSLQHAGALLDNIVDHLAYDDSSFIHSLGGLSNYINSILLYDECNYLDNGFSDSWARFPWFSQNTTQYFKPLETSIIRPFWNSFHQPDDQVTKSYLYTAQHFKSDLFIAPERSIKLTQNELPKIDSVFFDVLKKIDVEIAERTDDSWFTTIKIGIDKNFKFPSLIQYALSQATNKDDLLRVIMQLKSEGRVKRVRDNIYEIATNTKKASDFKKQVMELINKQFSVDTTKDSGFSVEVSALFLSFSKSINLDFFNRNAHIIFLKDIISCRTEANRISKDIQRIFNRRI